MRTALSGLTLGALYFMVAAGLTIIFGLMDVLNFAHGAMFMTRSLSWVAVLCKSNFPVRSIPADPWHLLQVFRQPALWLPVVNQMEYLGEPGR